MPLVIPSLSQSPEDTNSTLLVGGSQYAFTVTVMAAAAVAPLSSVTVYLMVVVPIKLVVGVYLTVLSGLTVTDPDISPEAILGAETTRLVSSASVSLASTLTSTAVLIAVAALSSTATGGVLTSR